MSELVEFIDGPLILVSWMSTIAFTVIGRIFFTPGKNRFHAAWLNAVLFGVVFIAFVNLSFLVHKPIIQLPYYCYARVWDGTLKRGWLLLVFISSLLASVIFCAYQTTRPSNATTAQRKFFHFTIGLIALSGILYDPKFVRLSAHLMLQIFIILEHLRGLQSPPWSGFLDTYLQTFIDPEQESSDLIMTPILLIFGVFLPLLFSPITPTRSLALYHFAGIATVGIGDSLAAIIGSKYGSTRLPKPFKHRKSFEGCLAMFLGQATFYSILMGTGIIPFTCSDIIRVLIAVPICTIVEAALPLGDNIVLPAIAWLILGWP